MKKIKLLMPMLGIATLTGTMMPLVSCGCKDKDTCNMIYASEGADEDWAELVSKKFTVEKGKTYQFSFKWSKALEITKPQITDDDSAWYFDLAGLSTENPDAPGGFIRYSPMFDENELVVKKNNKKLTKGEDYKLGEYGFWEEDAYVGFYPLKKLNFENNDIISGSIKIKDIWELNYKTQYDWNITKNINKLENCYFTVYSNL